MPSQKLKMLLLSVLFLSSRSFSWAGAQPAAQVSITKDHSLDLFTAIIKDDAALVRSAIASGANINQEIGSKSPLTIAVCNQKLNASEALLKMGADYNTMIDGQKLFHYCITHGLLASYLLIRNGADFSEWPSHDFDIFYYISSVHGKYAQTLELVTELLHKGYNPNKINICSLQNIVTRSDILEILLKNGLNPNLISNDSRQVLNGPWTPLAIAVSRNNIQSAKLLIAAGADVNLAAPKTPLSYAVDNVNIEMIEFLQSHGARL